MSAAAGLLLAVAAAVCFGIASAGQFAVATAAPARAGLDLRLLRDVTRTGAWWTTAVVEAAAVGLQALALRRASVVAVQALLVLGLPVAVLLSRRADARTCLGLALTTAGVAAFAAAQPARGSSDHASVLLPVVVAGAAALLLLRRPPDVVGGTVAGVVTGCAAVLLAALVGQPLHLLLVRPPLYAAAAVGLLALQVGQSALQADRLGPPLGALTLAEPVAAALLAAGALHQLPRLSPLTAAGALAATAGVVLLRDRPDTH